MSIKKVTASLLLTLASMPFAFAALANWRPALGNFTVEPTCTMNLMRTGETFLAWRNGARDRS